MRAGKPFYRARVCNDLRCIKPDVDRVQPQYFSKLALFCRRRREKRTRYERWRTDQGLWPGLQVCLHGRHTCRIFWANKLHRTQPRQCRELSQRLDLGLTCQTGIRWPPCCFSSLSTGHCFLRALRYCRFCAPLPTASGIPLMSALKSWWSSTENAPRGRSIDVRWRMR